MIDVSLGFLVSSLPWWAAAPLLQLTVLVVGMALDETYVNRTTVLTGALAVHIHGFVAGEVGALVALYGDLGLVIGAYGLYAYVVDGYVGDWFRLLAYFVYSPLSVFLVILTAGPTLFGVEPLVLPALAAAGYANVQFREYLRPREPYYFGPESPEEFETAVAAEATADGPHETEATAPPTDGASASDAAESTATEPDPAATQPTAPGSDPDAAQPTASSSDPGATRPTASGPDPAATQPTGGETADAATDGAGEGAFDDPDVPADGLDHPGAEPAAAADSSERGILPQFMRRL